MRPRTKSPPCKFGNVLADILREKGMNPYDIERASGISAVTIHRFIHCMRLPSPFRDKAVNIVDLAEIINATDLQKKELYKALIETFYPGLCEYFPSINIKKLTDEYISDLLSRKPVNRTWTEIYDHIPEPTLRKVRQLKTDISLLNSRDVLKDILMFLNISDKQKAEILLYFLIKKGADPEFIKKITEP